MANIVDGERSIYVASFPESVDEDLLEELFTQVGPVTKVLMKKLNNSETRFALIEFEDEESVLFAIETLDGIKLFNTPIVVKPRNSTQQEQKWRQAKSEIDRRQRSNPTPQQKQYQRDNYKERDNHRQSFERDGRSSSYRRSQPYEVPDRSRNRPQYQHQHSTPSMPHTQFINAVLRQNSTPSSHYHHNQQQQHQTYTPRREEHQNDRGYNNRSQRNSSSYTDRRSYDSGGGSRQQYGVRPKRGY